MLYASFASFDSAITIINVVGTLCMQLVTNHQLKTFLLKKNEEEEKKPGELKASKRIR